MGAVIKKNKNKRNELKVVKMLHGAKGNCRGFCGVHDYEHHFSHTVIGFFVNIKILIIAAFICKNLINPLSAFSV